MLKFTVVFVGLLALAAAVPVMYKPDEIPVHVVYAEPEIVTVPAKDTKATAVVVEAAPLVPETPLIEAVTKPAEVVVELKPEEKPEEVVQTTESEKNVQEETVTETEQKALSVETPVATPLAVAPVTEIPDETPVAVVKEEEKEVKENPKEEEKKVEEQKPVEVKDEKNTDSADDMETQASTWGGWSSSAWPVATTYHAPAVWTAAAAPTYYTYPSVHYSRSYWPGYSQSGWW